MAKCPSCDRKFRTFEDYHSLYVSNFARFALHPEMKFPYFHGVLDHIEAVPDEVRGFLERESTVVSKIKRVFSRRSEPVKGIGMLGPFLNYDGRVWVSNKCTGLACFSKDERSIILDHVNPYLDHLESLVQETVSPAVLLPDLARYSPSDLLFAIPDSGYDLALGKSQLRRLGWLGEETEEFYEKMGDPGVDKRKVISEMINRAIECEKSADGEDLVGLYIIGLRPADTSSMFGLTVGERFKVKIAEFAYKGKVRPCEHR